MRFEAFFHSRRGTSIVQINFTDKTSLNDKDFVEISRYIDNNDAVLLRGFNIKNGDDFKAFSGALCEVFRPYAGGAFEREMVNGDNTLLEVSGGKTSLVPLHGEMYYSAIRPSRLWFFCETPPGIGGETQVCNCRAFYQGLSETTKQELASRNVSYIVKYTDREWQVIFQTSDLDVVRAYCKEAGMTLNMLEAGGVETVYTTSPLLKTSSDDMLFINNLITILGQEYVMGGSSRIVRWENGEKIPLSMFQEFIRVSDQLAYNHKWQYHDLLVLNNNKVLHGRTQVTDQNRRILVRLGYKKNLCERDD